MRDPQLTSAKATLRGWFASRGDAYLARVVIECRDGRFKFRSSECCIRGLCEGGYDMADSDEALAAESALYAVGGGRLLYNTYFESDERVDACAEKPNYLGRVRTLPIVLAEIKKRHRVPTAPPVEVACE